MEGITNASVDVCQLRLVPSWNRGSEMTQDVINSILFLMLRPDAALEDKDELSMVRRSQE